MSPSNTTVSSSSSPLGRFDKDHHEQLPLLSRAATTPSSTRNTLIDIANQHELHVEADPVISHEFWEMLALVYPVVRTVDACAYACKGLFVLVVRCH